MNNAKVIGKESAINATFAVDALEKDGSECRYVVHAAHMQAAYGLMKIEIEFGSCAEIISFR